MVGRIPTLLGYPFRVRQNFAIMKTTVTVNLSKERGHLVFFQNEFDTHGVLMRTRKAAMPISPKHDPDDMLEKARQLCWEIYGEPDDNGFYKVRQVQPTTKGVVRQEVRRVDSMMTRMVEKKIDNKFSGDTVLVVEAELALASTDGDSSPDAIVVTENGDRLQPVLTTTSHEWEYPEEGDKYYDAAGGYIRTMTEDNGSSDSYTILAWPRHLSPKHMMDINKGLMKRGDRVMIECYTINNACYLKFDALNHVILHEYVPTEEERERTKPRTIPDKLFDGLVPDTSNWSAAKMIAVIAFIWMVAYTCEGRQDADEEGYEYEINADRHE